MAGVNVIVADTDEAARRLFTSLQQVVVGLVTGSPGRLGPPLEAPLELLPPVRQQVDAFLGCSFVGSIGTVQRELEAFVARTGVDELIVATAVFDPEARKRSYTLLAGL
jgi:alkanesulfonate monooxygenase SsuD/methylene tetrahydromethanopterin reductase-like flavin-dependent oxidoreductase (luciferase family)